MRLISTAYGSALNLAWLVKDKKITPHIPVFDKSNRTDGTFSRADFTFDADANHYVCPADKLLVQFRRSYDKPRSGITKAGAKLYRASKKDCSVCELKPKWCPNMVARKVPRYVNEDARDVARALVGMPEYERARRRDKEQEIPAYRRRSRPINRGRTR